MPAQAAPIEWSDQLREQLRTFLRQWAHPVERREHLRLLGWVATAVAASQIISLDSEEQERLSKAIVAPSRVDAQVIDHIEMMLKHCKRQDDILGPQAVLHIVLDQRELVRSLLDDCPDGLRPRLLSVYSLMRWIRKKYKRLRGRKKAQEAWNQAITRRPRFFAHWAWVTYAPKVW